ncbi:MAG TPA: class I SAM-dependent methyltransferase [Anaerolineales bacterium]
MKHTFHKGEFDIWRCARCGSMFVHNVPGAAALSEIYAAHTYYELPDESVERIRQENQRRLRSLPGPAARRTILDVGCAQGLLLDGAQAMGFQTYGTELSAANVSICVQHGHKVIKGYVQDITDVPEGGFDVIACLDVIEHVDDPLEFLSRLIRLLSDSGILVVSTPNYSGIVAKLLGRRDPYMIPPEHLNFFTRQGMIFMFRKCSLKIEKRVTFGRLTSQERQRAILKFFPAWLKPLSAIINSLLPIIFHGLNFARLGLEQEFYLSRRG